MCDIKRERHVHACVYLCVMELMEDVLSRTAGFPLAL